MRGLNEEDKDADMRYRSEDEDESSVAPEIELLKFNEGMVGVDNVPDNEYLKGSDFLDEEEAADINLSRRATHTMEWIGADENKIYETDSTAKNEEGEGLSHLSDVPLQRLKTRIFSKKMRNDRRSYGKKFVFNILALGTLMIIVFCIFWGILYDRPSHYWKVNFLAVVEDNGELGEYVTQLMESSPATYHIYNSTTFREKYGTDVNIEDKVHELVHHQKFWGSLMVFENATSSLTDSLEIQSAPSYNFSDYFQFFYESGRDLLSFDASILPLLTNIEQEFQEYYFSSYYPQLLSNYSSVLASSTEKLSGTSYVVWNAIDNRPFNNPVLIAPLDIGLVYCILVTFFQFALFVPIHSVISPKIKTSHIIMYRLFTSWAAYFFLSLFFCTISAIYQVDFTLAFGKAGFIVYWMSTWLIMGAIGGANENAISLIIAFAPQYLGFWLLSWIVLNITPSFFPMVLANNFYRYGYIMPVENAVGIYKVVFLNLYKGHMGLNYGVLIAWCVVNTLLLPLVLKLQAWKFASNAKKSTAASPAVNKP